MNQLKTIIVDDSKVIRTELKLMLAEFPEIIVTGEAANVAQAVTLLEQQRPNVIFLDIQLNNETGFDLLEKTNITSKIIFITAHNHYAIRAFEVNALDYLLKPIQKDRLKKAIDRLIPQDEEVEGPKSKIAYDDVVYLMINHSLKFIKIASIKSIIAEGKYSFIIHGDKRKDLASKTLLEWEKILPEKYFLRIHRSTIVNFEHVDKVKKCPNNTHEVYVKEVEEPFTMSRRYAAKLKSMLSL